MSTASKTRNNLILRLRNRDDVQSWREFVAIYQPVIYRVARARGLQDAAALELVQRVLIAVARAVDRFQPDKNRAKFRTWLYRITHNEFCKEIANSQRNHDSLEAKGNNDSGSTLRKIRTLKNEALAADGEKTRESKLSLLKETLQQTFDESIKLQETELDALKERVAKLNAIFEKRKSNRDRVIENYIDRVRLQAEGLTIPHDNLGSPRQTLERVPSQRTLNGFQTERVPSQRNY